MLRALSSIESFFIDYEITIVTITDLKGMINALTLQKAIDAVVMMHPLLSSEVTQTDDLFYFTKRDAIDDKLTIIGNVNKDKRKQIILSELNKPLTKKSLFRFTLLLEERIGILKNQTISLITTIHHAVSDGISCVALQEQIWKLYAEISNDETPTVKNFPLMPAIENLIPQNFSDVELTDYIERYTNNANNYQPFIVKPAELNDATVEISYIQKRFTLKQTKSILERCKIHKVSAHGAICAANLLALKDLFGKDAPLDLSCHSPIDVRSRIEPTIEKNAMLTAAVGCMHIEKVTSDMSLWTLGENISKTIKNHIASGDIFKSLLTYKETRLKSNIAVSIGVTNVGLIEMPTRLRKLKLISINFIPRIPLPMLAACVITSGGKLTITYPYTKPYYSATVIKKIAERTAHYLLTS